MKKKWTFLLFIILVIGSCSQLGQNPFLTEWDTPFGTPPFDRIKEAHYLPAIIEGIRQEKQEIEEIVSNADEPTFENTIEALEKSGALLSKVTRVFGSMNSAMTNDNMQAIAKEAAPIRSKHRDDILLNEDLFERIKAVYEGKDQLDLSQEQEKLLDEIYKNFVRGGANLDNEKKEQLREINEELSLLTLQFGENVLKEINRFEMVVENEADLAGLPERVVTAAAEAAEERGYEGKWVFTLHKPSWIPFLQYSQNRDLKEKIYKAWMNVGNNDDELDNKSNAARIAALRVKRANLMGYNTYADFVLERNMAKVPKNVYDLLHQLWTPALAKAEEERREMQKIIDKEGGDFKLAPWDWWYYAEKVKQEKYALDENELRPYFQLENVIQGVFSVANKLWGLQFVERTDIPKYHEDVTIFEVKESDGSHIGILYTDYFPRTSKRGGAWMSSFRKQSARDGKNITPIIYNCGNFTKPTPDQPSLISLDEVLTLFHEFGHGLHGLLSDCTYEQLSGTSVARDFVELPSQIMEKWALEPEVLKMYAKHYETGKPIPNKLIQKIKKSGTFNQGFATVEYLATSFLDMDWHTISKDIEHDALAFETKSMDRIGLIPEIIPRWRTTYLRHIFSGGYAAGYYSYIWAEVLDSDAFQAFKETDLFDQETAQAFRTHILSKGGTEDAMVLYKRFRGREPKIDPLLERRGLK
jgi:peptidyl-dipeptidase Dcp